MAYLNIVPTALVDGVLHASSSPLTSTEATLGNTGTPDPIPIIEGQEILAIGVLTVNGKVISQNTYIMMQTDLNGDGNWIDVAWFFDNTLLQGSKTFVLTGGGRGLMNNSFVQSRQVGSAPATQASGSNAVIVGGRVRFTGKTLIGGGGSSVSAGLSNLLTCNITYKLTVPR